MMANPLMRRELVGLLRTRRSIVMLLAVAVAFSLLIVARWPSDGVTDLTGARSRAVFRVFSYGLLGMVALLVPVFPATSIVTEKRSGTLALLLNSPLSAFAIYAGKASAVLGFAALLLFSTVPAIAACFTLGGVSLAAEIVPLYGVLCLASVQYASWALFVSSMSNNTDGAVRGSYGGVLCMFLLVLIPHYFLQGSEGLTGTLAAYLRCLSPVPGVMEIVGHADVGSHGLINSGSAVGRFVLLGGATSLLFVVLTLRRLNWTIFDQSRSQGTITDDREMSTKVARRLFFLIDPQRRKSGIAWFTNPVMVKEFRCRQFGRLHWLLRLISGCALVSLVLAFAATRGSEAWGVEEIGGIIVSMQVALIVLFTPALASGLISSERESGGWDLLRMTPLSANRIVRGKLISVIFTLVLVLMASLPGYGVMIWIKPVLREQITQVMICLSLGSLFCILLSATVSSFFEKTAPATVASYALLLGLWAGSLLIWLGRDAPFGFRTVEAALSINPMAAALSVIETPGFETYNLIPLNWWLMGIGSAGLLLLLLFRTWRLTKPE